MALRACSSSRVALVGLVASVMVAMGCGSDGGGPDDLGAQPDTGLRSPDIGVTPDLGPDLGPPSCDEFPLAGEIGGACRGGDARICNGMLSCISEQTATVGGADDPITDHPDGPNSSFEIVDFPGDYCAGILSNSGTCTTTDRLICSSICGVCASVFSDANVCLKQCTPNAVDNDICRDDYQCDVLRGACDVGCTTDDECRVTREDTDGSGEIEPFDSSTGMGDNLVYRTTSQATCNAATARCEHPGTPGAEAGAPCEFDDQCEANGRCLDEVRFEFPGGYCSKYRCDFDGNDCAGDGVCQSRGLGFPACLAGCDLGTGAVAGDPSTYVNNTQGCRDGYTCRWDGSSTAADSPNGACVPAEFTAVATSNVGVPCTSNDDCYSPFGNGLCLTTGYPDGYCSAIDCSTPGMPNDVCGPNALCVLLSGDTTLCVQDCDTATDCRETYACSDIDGNLATPGTACFPDCLSNSECRAGETCVMMGGSGVCTPP